MTAADTPGLSYSSAPGRWVLVVSVLGSGIAGATRIFDGRVLTYGGKDYPYLTAGNGSSGFRVFRLVQ